MVNSHSDNPSISRSSPFYPIPAGVSPKEEQVGRLLEEFCTSQCHNIPPAQMKKMILEGEALEKKLVDIAAKGFVHGDDWKNEITRLGLNTPENAANLMWLLTKKGAERGDLFSSGVVKVAGGMITGKMVEQFLLACGNGKAYSRISTHMGEKLKADETQYGLDLRDKGLPAEKHHILFAAQPDGSIFIKMEKNGCPPFWEKGFRTLDNFREFFRHAVSYISSRPPIAKIVKFLGLKSSPQGARLEERKEHVPAALKREFKKTVDLLFPSNRVSFFEKLGLMKSSNEKIAQKIYSEGKTHGITRMRELISEIDEGKLTLEQKLAREHMRAKLENFEEKATKGVSHIEVKGNEVILPPLGSK